MCLPPTPFISGEGTRNGLKPQRKFTGPRGVLVLEAADILLVCVPISALHSQAGCILRWFFPMRTVAAPASSRPTYQLCDPSAPPGSFRGLPQAWPQPRILQTSRCN